MTVVLDLYTVQIIRDTDVEWASLTPADVDAMMQEAQENLTDLLPLGYRAAIRRWDVPYPDEPTQEDHDE